MIKRKLYIVYHSIKIVLIYIQIIRGCPLIINYRNKDAMLDQIFLIIIITYANASGIRSGMKSWTYFYNELIKYTLIILVI